jgi:hypothetical protein
MKKLMVLLLATVLMVAFTVTVNAETGSGTYSGTINGLALGITKDADMSFDIARTAGQTSYSTFSNTTPAKFLIAGDYNIQVALTIPASTTLTRSGGSETATANVVCRMSQTGYVSDAAQGDACTATATTSATDGKLYLTIFPSGITFNSDVPGTYTGTITVSATQQ